MKMDKSAMENIGGLFEEVAKLLDRAREHVPEEDPLHSEITSTATRLSEVGSGLQCAAHELRKTVTP